MVGVEGGEEGRKRGGKVEGGKGDKKGGGT